MAEAAKNGLTQFVYMAIHNGISPFARDGKGNNEFVWYNLGICWFP